MKKSLITSDIKFLSERGKDELYASNAYRYAKTCTLSKGLLGFVKFFDKESKEELEHRTKLEEFANDMGDELDMPAIPAVEFKSEDVNSILNEIYKMELDLLAEYEMGMEDCNRGAVKVLCQEMVEIQTKGVGAIGVLIAELENTSVEVMNLRLLA
jgi:bacterioferritin (cytochrome b1)